jgi:AraC family transcriptional regulator
VRVAKENAVNSATERYRARFRKVLEHIETHLDDDLCADRLSAVATFSPFHFQRQFSALFDVGVFKYVQLARLKRASYALAFRIDRPVTDIALASGYEGAEAFARAFKKTFGQTPSEFRERPQWDAWHATYRPLKSVRTDYMKTDYQPGDVRIVDVDAIAVAAFEHRGHPDRIGDSTRRFIEWRRQNGLPPKTSATYNVVYKHTDDECHYDLCAATSLAVADNAHGVVGKTIPAGRCALLRHVGTEDALGAAIDFLYATWLPQSGEELRDLPVYFHRINMFPDVPEHDWITDIYLPLA